MKKLILIVTALFAVTLVSCNSNTEKVSKEEATNCVCDPCQCDPCECVAQDNCVSEDATVNEEKNGIVESATQAIGKSQTSITGAIKNVGNQKDNSVEAASQGRGACTQPNCKCQSFNQRPGYNQCWCGHQSFSHR